jgi:hypothetical protein
MNITPPLAVQAPNFPQTQVFPQPIPAVILAMSGNQGTHAILHLFDAGAIDGDTAESWLLSLEELSNS